MAGVGAYIYNTLSTTIFGPSYSDCTEEEIDYPSAMFASDRYQPSVDEVLTIKEALHKKSTLPYELIDAIIEMAEYWPHNTTVLTQPTSIKAGRDHENRFLVSQMHYSPHLVLSLTIHSYDPIPWAIPNKPLAASMKHTK